MCVKLMFELMRNFEFFTSKKGVVLNFVYLHILYARPSLIVRPTGHGYKFLNANKC